MFYKTGSPAQGCDRLLGLLDVRCLAAPSRKAAAFNSLVASAPGSWHAAHRSSIAFSRDAATVLGLQGSALLPVRASNELDER